MASLRVEYPLAVLPGRLVTQVLSMAAGQYSDPVPLFVLTEIKDSHSDALYRFIRPRVAFGGALG